MKTSKTFFAFDNLESQTKDFLVKRAVKELAVQHDLFVLVETNVWTVIIEIREAALEACNVVKIYEPFFLLFETIKIFRDQIT